ncbi:MAG: phosphodiester glycosidase family protein, partial [Nakamurella sp.]
MSFLHRRRGDRATTAAVIAALGVATLLAPLAPAAAEAAASTAPVATAAARTVTPATAPAAAPPTAPAAAPAADTSYPLRGVTEKLGPGITLDRRTTLTGEGWFDDQVLTVDLAQPAVSTDLITAGPGVSDRGPISAAANARGAVAATNGDFFDIDGSGAPLGAAVQGGELLKSAQIGGRVQVGITRDRIASVVDAAIEATATLGGAAYPVLALNTVNGSSPADALIAFTPGWGTASRSRGLEGAPAVVEALVVDGAIRSVTDGPGTGVIPSGAFVLQARGASAAELRALPIGTPAALDYRLKDELAGRMNMVIGANAVLVRDGAVVQQTDTSLAPRTALGMKDDGRT